MDPDLPGRDDVGQGGDRCEFSPRRAKSSILLSRIRYLKIRIYPCLVRQITGTGPPSPRHHEGRSRDRHGTWCGLRWTLRRQAGFDRRTKTLRRTAKSCGPGAATLASIPAGLCWQGNGDNKGRSPGRVRISRKAIARGKPGCLGCTCIIRVRSLDYPLHTVLRAQSAPGFPCALFTEEGANEIAKLRRNRAVRTGEHVHPRHCERRVRRNSKSEGGSEAIQLCRNKESWIASSLCSSQ